MASTTSLYPITPEALQWRDLGKKTQKALDIAISLCVVGAIAALAGTAVGIYFALPVSHVYILPVAIDGPLLAATQIGLAVLAYQMHKVVNGSPKKIDDAEKNRIIGLLTRANLKDIHFEFYRKNGGLTHLVCGGFLQPTQGDKLRTLLGEYNRIKMEIDKFQSQPYLMGAIQQKRAPKAYIALIREQEALEGSWLALQKELCSDYNKVPILTKVTPQDFNEIVDFKPMKTDLMTRTWSSLTPQQRGKDVLIKFAFVLAIILLLAGTAVGTYLSITTSTTHTLSTGEIISYSNTPFCAIPLAAGPAMIAIIALFYRLEWYEKKIDNDLKKLHIRDDHMLLLTEGSLESIHSRYFSRHDGIGPFVRQGFLLRKQAEELQALIKCYDTVKKDLEPYQDPSNPFQNDSAKESPAYHRLLKKDANLEKKLKLLQEEIKGNFTEGIKEKNQKNRFAVLEKRKNKPAKEPKRKENLSTTSSGLIDLPPEAVQHILSFLPVKDLGNVCQVSTGLAIQACEVYEKKGKGFRGDLVSLRTLLKGVKKLASQGFIPTAYHVVREGFFSSLDVESTLKKLSFLSGEEQEHISEVLGQALFYYIVKGDLKMVNVLITLGADVDVRNKKGSTPLMKAIDLNECGIAKRLIDLGADVHAVNQFNTTPLYWAVYHNSYDMALYLLEHGVQQSINFPKDTSLHLAVQQGNVDMVKLLLKYGADSTIVNSKNQTPVDLVSVNSEEIYPLLLGAS